MTPSRDSIARATITVGPEWSHFLQVGNRELHPMTDTRFMTPTASLVAFKYLFDWQYYVKAHPDLAQLGITNQAKAISHWIVAGRKEGRSCGMKGVEIGGSAHNDFFLDTVNVDLSSSIDDIYRQEQIRLSGTHMPVDVVADGGALPFKDKSFDYVLTSHVIEHFYDPIATLREWRRVARRYLFLIVPHKYRTGDQDRSVTTVEELVKRHEQHIDSTAVHDHYSVWTPSAFMRLMDYMKLRVLESHSQDDKRGNGFTVVIGL